MVWKTWLACKALAAGLTLALAVTVLGADALDSTPARDRPDPRGTTVYMDQFRALFDAWDLNMDGYLDKAELAKAFRGPDAKPYDYKPEKKTATKDADKDKDVDKDASTSASTTSKPINPDYSNYPDYNFLIQLDQDKDEQISRPEFMSWARDQAVLLKQQDVALTRLARLQQKLASLQAKLLNAKPNSKQYQNLQKQLRAQQAAINKMNAQMNRDLKALNQSVQKALKTVKP
jgi:hypothetical protein